jgi:hypothetical protein
MLLRSFSRHLRDHDWLAVFVEVIVVAVGFRANDELQAWLTKAWGMQRELQWVHGRRRGLAEDALEALRAYQAQLGRADAQ